MTLEITEQPVKLVRHDERTCTDYDEDCEDVRCKATCWVYAPERGMCPYLRESGAQDE